eukprot:GFUD01000574.1.p1 GENE.GFUD01000574.1~~GFUD01000574.1.p1  ORF type:complete len:366 (+),score=93.95 GFUD01000574.1:72-1169(+)
MSTAQSIKVHPFSFDSNSNAFTWKLPVEDWSKMAEDDHFQLRFRTLLPPDNKTFRWCLEVYPKGTKNDDETMEVILKMIPELDENDMPKMCKIQMETAYRIRKPTDTDKPFDMYSSRSYGTYHSSEFEGIQKHTNPWIFLNDSYDIDTAEERSENGFIIFQFEIRTFSTPVKIFQSSAPKQRQMFLQKLESFYDEGSGDVKILCDGEEFLCHKLLLTSHSPVFRAMFSQDTKENAESTILLDDSTPEAVQELLFYLYHGTVRSVPFSSAETELVLGLVHLASKYQIEELLEICKDVMIDIVNMDNILKMMVVIDKYPTELEEILRKIFGYAKENIDKIIKKEEWREFVITNPSLVTEFFVNNMKK